MTESSEDIFGPAVAGLDRESLGLLVLKFTGGTFEACLARPPWTAQSLIVDWCR